MNISLSSIKKPKVAMFESQLSNPTILRYSRCKSHIQNSKIQPSFCQQDYLTPRKDLLNQQDYVKDSEKKNNSSAVEVSGIPLYKYNCEFHFKQKQVSHSKSGFLRIKTRKQKVPKNLLAQQEAIRQAQNVVDFSTFLEVSKSGSRF